MQNSRPVRLRPRLTPFLRLLSRGGVIDPGMGGVMEPAETGVKRRFERAQECVFLPDFATAFLRLARIRRRVMVASVDQVGSCMLSSCSGSRIAPLWRNGLLSKYSFHCGESSSIAASARPSSSRDQPLDQGPSRYCVTTRQSGDGQPGADANPHAQTPLAVAVMTGMMAARPVGGLSLCCCFCHFLLLSDFVTQ
jgi:hypothetical protein